MITISPNIELLKEAERMFETFKSEDIDRLSKYSSRYASRLDMIFPLAFKQRTKLMRQDNLKDYHFKWAGHRPSDGATVRPSREGGRR